MSENVSETPTTPEASETPATPASQEVTPETPKGEMPGESDEAEGLRKALKAERSLRESAEKAAKQATRTNEERLADLERQNSEMKLERLANAAVDNAIAGLGKDFTVSRAEIMEELGDAKLSEANVDALVARWVNKLKKPATVKTPDNSTPPISSAGKKEPDPRNPWAGANF